MKNNHITWFGRYEGYLRTISRGVRDNNPKCIECAAKLFDLMLPEGALDVLPDATVVALAMSSWR